MWMFATGPEMHWSLTHTVITTSDIIMVVFTCGIQHTVVLSYDWQCPYYIEVCHGSSSPEWTPVCGEGFDIAATRVICGRLEFPIPGTPYIHTYVHTVIIILFDDYTLLSISPSHQ